MQSERVAMCRRHGVSERTFVNASEHNNCVICLVEALGPMNDRQIAQYLNISDEYVGALQIAA